MGTSRTAGVVVGVGAVILVVAASSACSDDELTPSENARLASECSSAPAQYSDANPPSQRPFVDHGADATCAARCGSQQLDSATYGRTWTYESLPSGACTKGTHCAMAVSYTQTCGTDRHACNLSNAQCECESGQWRCYLAAVGAALCTPCDFAFDGGAR